MSKLANHIALYLVKYTWGYIPGDNTGYLVKYIDPRTGSKLINSEILQFGPD
jgi:hypothetical protein